MLILGLTKTTLLDYPGKVAATVFTGGCNFRCPYCHNGQLVINPSSEPKITEDEVFEHLTKRRKVLEGVCITGGEPTIQADLKDFICRIKDMGYMIKLDTNGTNPKKMLEFIREGLIDYVAMDVKNSPNKYGITTGCNEQAFKNVAESVEILKSEIIPYEFRTTVVRQFHTDADLQEIAKWIRGTSKWYLQSYKESDSVIQKGLSAYTKDELVRMTENIEGIDVVLRGLD